MGASDKQPTSVDIKWQVDYSAVRMPPTLATLVPLDATASLQDFADYYEWGMLGVYLYQRSVG